MGFISDIKQKQLSESLKEAERSTRKAPVSSEKLAITSSTSYDFFF